MPFALLIVGIFLLVSGVRNTQDTLFGLLHGDFTGKDNFIYWFIAIVIIGSVGYVPRLKPVSNSLLALVIVVLFLRRGGFFNQFTNAISGSTSSGGALSSPASTLQSLQNQLDNNLNQQHQTLNSIIPLSNYPV